MGLIEEEGDIHAECWLGMLVWMLGMLLDLKFLIWLDLLMLVVLQLLVLLNKPRKMLYLPFLSLLSVDMGIDQ